MASAARQRALPKTPELPSPQRRLCELCAPGYTGRKRGEVVRTRTIISQAHTSQWLGSFANQGLGLYREELRRAVAAIQLYGKAHDLSEERVLLRLDGQYGTGAVLADLASFCYVMRGKNYTVLDRTEVQSRLHLPPDQQFSRPESERVARPLRLPRCDGGANGATRPWSWWRPIRLLRRRAVLASPALAWSTNSFSRACRRTLSRLPMSSPSTC